MWGVLGTLGLRVPLRANWAAQKHNLFATKLLEFFLLCHTNCVLASLIVTGLSHQLSGIEVYNCWQPCWKNMFPTEIFLESFQFGTYYGVSLPYQISTDLKF